MAPSGIEEPRGPHGIIDLLGWRIDKIFLILMNHDSNGFINYSLIKSLHNEFKHF